jgi:predicted RNA-binding Zn-ribbon protein involved in translation (DUF1610 family)
MAKQERRCATRDCLGDLEAYHLDQTITMQFCPKCGKELLLVCSRCRADLPMAATMADAFKHCPNCGEKCEPRSSRSR